MALLGSTQWRVPHSRLPSIHLSDPTAADICPHCIYVNEIPKYREVLAEHHLPFLRGELGLVKPGHSSAKPATITSSRLAFTRCCILVSSKWLRTACALDPSNILTLSDARPARRERVGHQKEAPQPFVLALICASAAASSLGTTIPVSPTNSAASPTSVTTHGTPAHCLADNVGKCFRARRKAEYICCSEPSGYICLVPKLKTIRLLGGVDPSSSSALLESSPSPIIRKRTLGESLG